MPELVLYGIRLLAKQFLGAILDIEVDQSAGILTSSQGPCTVGIDASHLQFYKAGVYSDSACSSQEL